MPDADGAGAPAPRLIRDTEATRRPADRLSRWLRRGIQALLVAAPLAFGAVHEPAFIPLMVLAAVIGVASWGRGHWMRSNGLTQPLVPGRLLLLALHVLVLLQLVPLPPDLLRQVSPGTYAFHHGQSLVPLAAWHPVAVSPPDTIRGLLFLAMMTLLYSASCRELGRPADRRRLAGTIVLTGFVMTLVALVQAASGSHSIYGVWSPRHDWAVFGPFVNKNHFAGYMVMALPLAIASADHALADLRAAWRRRRLGWLALGDAEGPAIVRQLAAAMVLVVGLLASRSRGGLGAFVLSSLLLGALLRRRQVLAVAALASVLGLAFVGVDRVAATFESRGLWLGRLELWTDTLPMAREFALLGAGLNGFGSAYVRWQTFERSVWFGEAHNEYLQSLLDLGVPGALLVASLLVLLLRRGFPAAREGALERGVLGALLGLCVHNLVEFNWQIPANAATFAVLAGLAVRAPDPDQGRRRQRHDRSAASGLTVVPPSSGALTVERGGA